MVVYFKNNFFDPFMVVFTLRRSSHVGRRKQKISYSLLLFVHQQLYIAALLSVSLEIGCCKPPICDVKVVKLQDDKVFRIINEWRPIQDRITPHYSHLIFFFHNLMIFVIIRARCLVLLFFALSLICIDFVLWCYRYMMGRCKWRLWWALNFIG